MSHPIATNLNIFPRIKWPNFLHNFQILCRIWKSVNSGKHWIAIVSKTVTGQYGFSIQFYSRRMISQVSSVSFSVYTLLCVGSWTTDSWGCGPKTGGVLWSITGYKISLSAIQMAICRKRPNFKIPYFRPSKCRPSLVSPVADAPPSSPFRCHCLLYIEVTSDLQRMATL